jgi:uncharacterized protein YtpQ (UPF0354 family)
VHTSGLARFVGYAMCVLMLALVACQPPAPGATAPAGAAATAAPTAIGNMPAPADAPFDGSTETALTESAARLFRKESPKVAVQIVAPRTLKLDFVGTDKHDIRISLDRMWAVCQSDPPRCEGAMRDFVSKVVRTVASPEEPASRDRVVALVRPRAWLESVKSAPEDKRPLADPLVDELYVAYVVDMPQAVRSLSRTDLDALKLTRAELPSVARANLAARLGHVLDAMGNAKAGDVVVLATGNYFESSRLLLSDDWTALSSKLAQSIVVSVPASDAMIVAIGPSPEQLGKLSAVIGTLYEKAQRPVSRRLFRWNAGSWAALP